MDNTRYGSTFITNNYIPEQKVSNLWLFMKKTNFKVNELKQKRDKSTNWIAPTILKYFVICKLGYL